MYSVLWHVIPIILMDCILYFRADDELVDPKKYLEDRCQPKCVKALYEYRVMCGFLKESS